MIKNHVESRNSVNLALLKEVYDPGVLVHDYSAPKDIIGLDALKEYYSNTHRALPDLNATINSLIPPNSAHFPSFHHQG